MNAILRGAIGVGLGTLVGQVIKYLRRKGELDSGKGIILIGLLIILATILLFDMSCGGGQTSPAVPSSHASNGRWVNGTSAKDETFFQLMDVKFLQAKQELNNPQVLLDGTPARAFTANEMTCMQSVQPRNWRVNGLQSVPAAELNALKDCQHCPYVDPTPFIYCPENPDFKYCNAYLHGGEIFVPDAYLDFVSPWEMDNLLMTTCHVDIGSR